MDEKGLSASFLGISACFFDPALRLPRHALLSMAELDHPHSGDKIAHCLDQCLRTWGITSDKVLLVISDNGSNMVKAIRLLQERQKEKEEQDDGDDEDREDDNSEDAEDLIPLARLLETAADVRFKRLPCMAHSLQLVIKDVYKHPSYEQVITKASRRANPQVVGHDRETNCEMW